MPVIKEHVAAIVTATDDPKKLGRIKVKCAEITGDPDIEIPEWIEPLFDWGWFFVPDKDEEVEVDFVVHDDTAEGVPGQAFIEEPRYRWRGKRFRSEEGDGARPPDEFFTSKNYGKRRGFSTPGGHVFMFDDTTGEEEITLAWKNETDASFLSFGKDGSVTINNKNGSSLFMDATNNAVSIIDENSNLISMSPSGVKAIDKFSNIIEMKDGVIQVLSQKDCLVKAGANITLDAGANVAIKAAVKITLESLDVESGTGADSPAVRGTDLNTYLTTKLSVPTAFGPSGPALAPLTPGVELSAVNKVK